MYIHGRGVCVIFLIQGPRKAGKKKSNTLTKKMNSHSLYLAHHMHQHCYPQTEMHAVCVNTHLHQYIQRTQKLFLNKLARQGHPAQCAQQSGSDGGRSPASAYCQSPAPAQGSSPQEAPFLPFYNSHKGEGGC